MPSTPGEKFEGLLRWELAANAAMLVNFKSEKKILQRSQGLQREKEGKMKENQRREGRKEGNQGCGTAERTTDRKTGNLGICVRWGRKYTHTQTHTTNKSSGG